MQDEIVYYWNNSTQKIIEAIKNGTKILQNIRNMTNACTIKKMNSTIG